MKQIQGNQLAQASTALLPLLRKHPALPEVNHAAAALHATASEHDRAIYYARRAAELAPSTPEYLAALGSILLRAGQSREAIEPLSRAIEINPALHSINQSLATARMQSGHIRDARALFADILRRDPANLEAANNLALLESDLGHADRAISIVEAALEHNTEHPMLLDALCMFACYSDTQTPEQVARIHRRFGQSVQARVRPRADHPNHPDPDRPIRVGFVSPDLRTHSIAYFLQPIIEHLDPDRFETYLYHTARATDPMSQVLKDACTVWRPCPHGMTEAQKHISADRIDLLVELNGHFAGNALPLFAARPAPVSATMIGYANTTGLTTIDARLIDAITDPAPQSDPWATERLVRLQGCFLCYRPPSASPPVTEPDPARPFTFASFNDLRKVSPTCIRAWSDILHACPDARLLLKTARLAEEEPRADLLARFARHDITPERLVLRARAESITDHLDLYNTADCALDTMPYTGTTTTCEAMHMGVPTVTHAGPTHASRVSASLLTTVGIPEWIASTTDDYITIATRAYESGKRTATQRAGLRSDLAASPLCDEPAYTARVADAFRALWQQWCTAQGATP